MSMMLRSKYRLINLLRLKNFQNNSRNCFNNFRIMCPRTGLVSQHGFFTTVAHNYKPTYEVGDARENSRNLSNNTLEGKENALSEIDIALREIDFAVRRTGRTVLDSVSNVLEMIANKGFATQTQSLYLLRCCGLLRLEVPAKRIELVQNIWNKLQELGVEFNVKHYNALLKVYTDSHHNFTPSDILISMEHSNIEPNQVTYPYLMEKYCQDGNLNGANEILECIKEKGISVNEAVFHSLIKGHLKINDISGAKEIMEVMRSSNISPTAETYTTLICGIVEKGNIQKVDELLLEAENNRVILQNNNYLQIIQSLPCNEHPEYVDKILLKMQNIVDWRQDFINTAAELVYKDMDATAFKLILSVSSAEANNGTNTFVKQLIKTDKPAEKIIQYCEEFYNKGLNNYILTNAAKAAVEFEKFDHAVAFFHELQNKGIPVRSRSFRNIFKGSSSPKRVWKYLKTMTELGLPIDFFTYAEYVFPAVPTEDPEKVISQIQDCGQNALSVVDPLFLYYCMTGQIENAAYLIDRYPVSVNTYFKLDEFLQLYDGVSSRPATFFKILKYILEHTGFPGQNTQVVLGEQLALFLLTYPKAFDEFHKTVGQKSTYSSQSLEICQNIVQGKKPSLLEHLHKFGNQKPFDKRLKHISPEEEENILQSDSSKGQYFKQSKLLELVSLHIKNRDVERLNRVKSELDNLGFTLSPMTLAHIFFLHCEINDLNSATETLTQLNKIYPTFKVDTSKLFDYARLFLKFSRVDEAINVIKDNCKEIHNFSGQDVLLRSLRRFLNNVVQTGDIDLAKTIQDSLKSYTESPLIKDAILEPLIKIHLFRKDYDSCLKEFKNCVVNFNSTPCLNLLLKHFILAEDQAKLQTLVDLASKCKGNLQILHELAIAFVELDRLQQATKIIQNLGRNVDFIFLTEVGMQYYSTNRVAELENILYITSGLNHNSRPILYHHLLKLYSNKNDYEKAGQVLELMKKEEMEPSSESKTLINKLFKLNNQSLPFANHTISPESNDIPTDLESINFSQFLLQRNVDEALKQLEKMKKGFVRTIPLSDISDLINLLIEENRLDDLSLNVNVMSYIIENSTDVFKTLFEKYSSEGNVKALTTISSVFPDFCLRKCSFNNFITKAYIESNRHEDLLCELENRLNLKNKLFSYNAFEELLKHTQYEKRVEELSKKYLEVNFDLPIAVAWSHYFINERYEKAEEISQIHPIPVDKVDVSILKHLRQTENITMGHKYVEFVTQLSVRQRTKERAYGALLNLLVVKQMYDDAVSLVMDAKSKKINLETHYGSTLMTLKSCLEAKNKPVPFSVSTQYVQS